MAKLTPPEFRRRFNALGRTQKVVAARWGVHPITFTRWLWGHYEIPLWLDDALQTIEREKSEKRGWWAGGELASSAADSRRGKRT